MSFPVHETEQGWIVAYTGRWVEKTLKPFPGEAWLSVDQARDRYESEQGVFEAVEASEREDDHLVHARWVFGVTRREMVRAEFFNRAGSIIISTDYVQRDDRLFISSRADYEYPDQESRYSRSDSLQIVSSGFKVDGTGFFSVRDNTRNEQRIARFKDADFSTLWFDWPKFGEWDVFTNPDHGILPHDFAMTPL